MKNIADSVRCIASAAVQADFAQNVLQTFNSPKVKKDPEEFIKVIKPFIENVVKLGPRFVDYKEIQKAISEATGDLVEFIGGKLKINPKPEPKEEPAIAR